MPADDVPHDDVDVPENGEPLSAPPATTIPRWVKVVAGVLSLAAAAHLAVTALWVAPSSVVPRAVSAPLSGYMEPVFQQNWSLFAPTPIRVENSLEVRFLDADLEATDWVDATALELTTLTHHVLPSRAGRPTRALVTDARAQLTRLSPEELAVLGGHYHHDAWPRLREALLAVDGPSSAARIDRVLTYDKVMAAYATELARATETAVEPAYVQFRIVRQPARPFADRGGELPEPTVLTFGRRPMYEFSGQDSESFTAAVERFRS